VEIRRERQRVAVAQEKQKREEGDDRVRPSGAPKNDE
jgi:hypothetical protein